MKNSLLIPNYYKAIGWITFIASFGLFIFCYSIYPTLNVNNDSLEFKAWDWTYGRGTGENFQKELLTTLILVGLLMISFAKEKQEDEYISLLRLKSWQWAVLISYGIFLMANLFIYGSNFLGFLIYNTLTILLVFILKFNISLWLLRKEKSADEK
ncbi:peptidoglycan/LPS O-acetylase OafA/YrhL [Pedobacter sp. UYP24]